MLARLAEAVDRGFQGGQRPFADQREAGAVFAQFLDFPLQGGDLGTAKQGGMGGLAGRATMRDAIAADELPRAGGKGEVVIPAL